MWENVFGENESNPSSSYGLIAREEQNGLAYIMIGDHDYRVVPVRGW
jgi:hypothetical protein